MVKYKIGPNGKMVAVADEKPKDESSEEFNKLLKEVENKNVQSDQVLFTPQDSPKGFFKEAEQVQQQPVYQQQPQQQYQQQYQQPQQQYQQVQQPQQQGFVYQEPVRVQPQQQYQQPVVSPVNVSVVLTEGEKFNIPLDTVSINEFMEQLNGAISEGSCFKIDSMVINCKLIKYYIVG
jgi:hypothetical protein